MAIGYNTFERGQLIKLYAVFIDIAKNIPASIVDPTITIQRWDGAQMLTIVSSVPMTHVADNKYVYEWQTTEDTVLDTYIASFAATVDDVPQHESIEIMVTVDTRRPEKPEGVSSVYVIDEEPEEPEEPDDRPSGVRVYVD